MARPGFNAAHWRDLSFEEGVLYGWIGQYSCGAAPRSSFDEHLEHYAPKVFPFFQMDNAAGQKALDIFRSNEGIESVFASMAQRFQSFREFRVTDDSVEITLCQNRLGEEVKQLQGLGVKRIVTLTELHHGKDTLGNSFNLHHFSIPDLNAPTVEQAWELAEIVREAREKNEVMAVHCLAGIGRTSTMLIASHMALGEKLEDLLGSLKARNPSFSLIGSQERFIRSLPKEFWHQ